MAKSRAQLDREIEEALNQRARYMLVEADTGKDMREAHEFEIKQIQGGTSKRHPKGHAVLMLGNTRSKPYSVTLRLLNVHQPTRRDRRDPTLPKGETFACLDRNGKILGTSTSVEGAMQKAPADKSYAIVCGEYTSNGAHWGTGKGRQMAVRESGRWQRG